MKPELLMLAPLLDDYEAHLAEHFRLTRANTPQARRAVLAQDPQRFAAVVTNGSEGVPPEIMVALANLELIAVNGVGVDKIDLEQARTRGIRIATTEGILSDAVADQAVGLLLALLRQICLADRFVRAGQWRHRPFPQLGTHLRGRRVGILGLGQIGGAIAERLRPFGVSLAYHNRHPRPDCLYPYYADLRALASASDILIVAAAGGRTSRHLVDGDVLDALGPAGVVVNVARGSVIDEAALVEHLRNGRLGGAALDVFEHQPEVPVALLGLDNVVLQPHLGSATLQTRQAMAQRVVEALLEWRSASAGS